MAVSIPGYDELDEIARGGFGVVYRAQHTELNRVVAVKVLSRVELDDAAVVRFDRERRAMGALSWHPHIVVVHDSGQTAEGYPFLVMEYLERGSLADEIEAGGPLPWQTAVALTIEVAGALQVAHDADLLHRDLKPANIMRGPYGEAKLTDFGIVGGADGGQTATGMVSFTLGHAAPEVLQGERATSLSDVYSLGSTLFELLTGRAPFLRAGEETIVPAVMRTINEPVPDLSEVDLPSALVDAVTMAMAKAPSERPATVAAFAQLLQTVQRGAGVPVTELRLDPRAAASVTGADVRSGDTIVPATGLPPAPPPPPPPASVAVSALAADSAPLPSPAPRNKMVVAAVSAVAVLVLVAAVAVLALSGGDDDAGGPSSTTSVTTAEDSTGAATTAAVPDTETGGGATENADLEDWCAAVDDYVATADAAVADPTDAELQQELAATGPELSATAVELARSGLSSDEQVRYQECTEALSGAGTP